MSINQASDIQQRYGISIAVPGADLDSFLSKQQLLIQDEEKREETKTYEEKNSLLQ